MWYFEPVWKIREKSMGGGATSDGDQPPVVPRQPKPFHVQTTTKTNSDGTTVTKTNHTSPDLINHLEVQTSRYPNGQAHHKVTLINRGKKGVQGLGVVSLDMHPNGAGTIEHRTTAGGLVQHHVPHVPDALRAMAVNHHTDHGWMPMLEKLTDEYHDHFAPHVERHTAARNKIPRPPKQWKVEKSRVGVGGPYQTMVTTHKSPNRDHSLQVTTSHTPTGAQHVVNIMRQTPRGAPVIAHLHIKSDGSTTFKNQNMAEPLPVESASDELMNLASGFHEGGGWEPLLGKLAGEYPDHFGPAVAAHTAVRRSAPAQPPRPTA
jgi:hypothetical protein